METENSCSTIKDFILKYKKIIAVFFIVVFIIVAVFLSNWTTRQNLISQIVTYLTDECRLNVEDVTLSKKYDSSGDFDGYNVTVYCNNLDIHDYNEMTSICYYCNLENVNIDKIVFNGDTYQISSIDVVKNGDLVFTKSKSKYTYVTLKCDHEWGDWKQDRPCDLYEKIRCMKCNEEKESREATNIHNCDSSGICIDCKEKIIYSQEDVKNIIQILSFDVGEYNGKVLSDIKIVWKNTSLKEITDIVFEVQAKYSDETDTKRCSSSTNVLPGEIKGKDTCWEADWPDMFGEKIVSITITYVDGSEENITGDYVNLAFWL